MKLSEVAELYPELKPFLQFFPFDELYPPQEEAIRKGALEKNFVLASGTASGKTLIAMLAAIRNVLEGRKVIYLAPLRALAFEKFREFAKLPFRVALSMGDYDSSDPWLGNYDIIVATYEKLDSLLRHRAPWLSDVGLVIFDEIHEMGNRAVVETLAVKMKGRRILGLSATVGNAEEIAEWLRAELVVSDFRPVPLREGVVCGRRVVYRDGEGILKSGRGGVEGVIEDSLKRGYQTLIFANTRREAEAIAERAGRMTHRYLNMEERAKLAQISREVLEVLSPPTKQCRRLAQVISQGAAFHHAGLVNEQRILVENAFREGLIKILASTVTLVAGLNLPSRRVVIRNPRSFRGWWSTSLYKQAAGRAGRPGYDEEGEALIMGCDTKNLFARYIEGKPEPVRSQLAYESVLRKEILGLFASGFAVCEEDIDAFLSETFYAFQYGSAEGVIKMGRRIVEQLLDWRMLERREILGVTKLGRRVAELYIDPYSAILWLTHLRPTSPFGYLHLIAFSPDMELPGVGKRDEEEVMGAIVARRDEFLIDVPRPWELEFERFARAVKLALIAEAWISEASEEEIMERFGVAPGDLRNYLMNMEWLTYALYEVVKVEKGSREDLKKLMVRVKHGVKEDLVELVKLPGIGRVKARKLKNAGITAKNIGKVSLEALASVVGEKTAEKVVKFLKR